MDFRTRIKELCQGQGITQKELAEKMGISDISLNKTLRGEYPAVANIRKDCEYIKCSYCRTI